MADGMLPHRSSRKRPFADDFGDEGDDGNSNKPPKKKKVRFPKGKKVKDGDDDRRLAKPIYEDEEEDDGGRPSGTLDPRQAAKQRAKSRNQITADLFDEEINDVSVAEVAYEDNEEFVEDGIQIEPFNLDKEREEGYFDADGNFVEYVNENEAKDPWLDSVEVDARYAEKISKQVADEDDDGGDVQDLSSEGIAVIKRRIANVLERGETVLQALRRLKGGSNNRREKMSQETQELFDQLTEDANKLMDHGEYNVYHDKQEVFEREAEGYERLALARGRGTSTSVSHDYNSGKTNVGISNSAGPGRGTATSVSHDNNAGTTDDGISNSAGPVQEIASNGADAYDMFADDDANVDAKPASDIVNAVNQTSSNGQSNAHEAGTAQNDYVYDETSGYYYSSSLGYYYDPSTGLYCNAASGQWYSFNEETGTYNEVNESPSNAS